MNYRIAGEDGIPVFSDWSVLGRANETALRVLLCLIGRRRASASAVAEAIGCREYDAQTALAFWCGTGIVIEAEEDEPEAKRPLSGEPRLGEAAADELARRIRDRELASFIDHSQQIFGHTFNTREMNVCVQLVDELGLTPAYGLLLFTYCAEGLGKKSVHYAERMAISLVGEQIDTVELLEEYIRRRERIHSRAWKIRRDFGIGDRALTKKEQECIERWVITYGYGEDVVERAREITVAHKERGLLFYADSILRRWYEAGCRSLAEVDALLEREAKERAAQPQSKGTASRAPAVRGKTKKEERPLGNFDTDEFFQRALERSYGKQSPKPDKPQDDSH